MSDFEELYRVFIKTQPAKSAVQEVKRLHPDLILIPKSGKAASAATGTTSSAPLTVCSPNSWKRLSLIRKSMPTR